MLYILIRFRLNILKSGNDGCSSHFALYLLCICYSSCVKLEECTNQLGFYLCQENTTLSLHLSLSQYLPLTWINPRMLGNIYHQVCKLQWQPAIRKQQQNQCKIMIVFLLLFFFFNCDSSRSAHNPKNSSVYRNGTTHFSQLSFTSYSMLIFETHHLEIILVVCGCEL